MEHFEEYLPALTPLAFGIVVFGVGLAFALRDRRRRKTREPNKDSNPDPATAALRPSRQFKIIDD
jgi:hypothetical protein